MTFESSAYADALITDLYQLRRLALQRNFSLAAGTRLVSRSLFNTGCCPVTGSGVLGALARQLDIAELPYTQAAAEYRIPQALQP